MRAFFFGLGLSAEASAHFMRQCDDPADVSGTVRTPAKADLLTHRSLSALLFDGTRPGPEIGPALARGVTHVIQSIPPDEAGDPVLRHHRAALDAAPDLQWLCYYSTVGVYGDFGGAWIDETAPTRPLKPNSPVRLGVEQPRGDAAQARGVPQMERSL